MFSSKSTDKRIDSLEKFVEKFATSVETAIELQSNSKEELGEWVAELSTAVIKNSDDVINLQNQILDVQKDLVKSYNLQLLLLERIKSLEN